MHQIFKIINGSRIDFQRRKAYLIWLIKLSVYIFFCAAQNTP